MSNTEKRDLIRIKFSRHGAPVWLAHLDVMHIFERGLRRAGLDLLYSQGYNPRPQLVFALPLGVGLEADEEILDAYLMTRPEETDLLGRLNDAMPEGIRILEARIDDAQIGKHLMADVAAARYRFDVEGLGSKVEALLQQETLVVSKFSKGKYRDLDIQPLWLGVHSDADHVEVLVKAGSHENLRPDLILDAAQLTEAQLESTVIVREALYLKPHPHVLKDGHSELLDPFTLEPIVALPSYMMLLPAAYDYLAPRLTQQGERP